MVSHSPEKFFFEDFNGVCTTKKEKEKYYIYIKHIGGGKTNLTA